MADLVQIIIVAALGVLGNIIYFEYQTHKKTSKDLLRQKLTNLLLPLYVVLHLDAVTTEAENRSKDGDDYSCTHSELPRRILPPIEKIIKENIYLAGDQLHEACLNFLQWAYNSDEDERFQRIMTGDFNSAIQDKDFKKFYDIVVYEYENARHLYLKK